MPDINVTKQDLVKWLKANKSHDEVEFLCARDNKEVGIYFVKQGYVFSLNELDAEDVIRFMTSNRAEYMKLYHTIYFAYHTVEEFINAL